MTPSPRRHLILGLFIALSACTEDPDLVDAIRLEPLLLPDEAPNRLLRPRAAVALGDGTGIVLVEEGRPALTTLDLASGTLLRRPIWPRELRHGVSPTGSHEIGTALARGHLGFWTIASGLGPLFIPDAPGAPPAIMGAGAAGLSPVPGMTAAAANLTNVRGLALDRQGRLLLAMAGRLFRVEGGRLETPFDPAPLGFGSVVGITTDGDGCAYVSDASSGRVWQMCPGRPRVAVAGGGNRLFAPAEPIPSTDVALELGRDQLAWDDARDQLLLLNRSVLHRLEIDSVNGSTIRALPASLRAATGLAVIADRLLVTTLRGTVLSVDESGSEVVWSGPDAGPLDVGRATAVEALGTNALLVQDPALRRLTLWAAGADPVPFWSEISPTFPPSAPLAADAAGHVYLQTTLGLRSFDIATVTSRVLAQVVPDPFLDGQTVHDVALPCSGALDSTDSGELLLLDQEAGLIVAIAPTTGRLTLVAGAIRGGGQPRRDESVLPAQLNLQQPSALAVDGELVLIAEVTPRGAPLFAVNRGAARRFAGRDVGAGLAVSLGGSGDANYEPGLSFSDVGVGVIQAVIGWDGGLILAVDDTASPPLLSVDAEGVLDAPFAQPAFVPEVLLAVGETVLMARPDGPELLGLNLGAAPARVGGRTLDAGELAPVAFVEDGVADLATDRGGRVFILTASGQLRRLDDEVLGRASNSASALAVLPDGGLVVLDEGGLWALAPPSGASLFGAPLPPSPGARIVDPLVGFSPDTRLAQLPFGANVSALALGPVGDLHWIDADVQALYRALPDPQGRVDDTASVQRLANGEPIPPSRTSVLLEVNELGEVLLGYRDRVQAWTDGHWERRVGGGDAAPAIGMAAQSVRLNDLSGLAVDGPEVWVRAREGLVMIDRDGSVRQLVPSLATDAGDGSLVAFAQSLASLNGVPVLALGGGVYRVRGLTR